jgi:hypothetical protein
MLRVCLVYSSMRLGVPFIAPRQIGAVESIPGRQFLPSVDWRTGQSGAEFFPILAQPTVEDLEPLAHRTLSCAHRTVRCPLQTVGPATRCDGTSQVIRPTYSCPCLTDIRYPVDVPKLLDKLGIFPYFTRNSSCRHYRTSEKKKCGSDYINSHLFRK